MKIFSPLLIATLGLLVLSACSDVKTDPTYSDKAHDDLYKKQLVKR